MAVNEEQPQLHGEADEYFPLAGTGEQYSAFAVSDQVRGMPMASSEGKLLLESTHLVMSAGMPTIHANESLRPWASDS